RGPREERWPPTEPGAQDAHPCACHRLPVIADRRRYGGSQATMQLFDVDPRVGHEGELARGRIDHEGEQRLHRERAERGRDLASRLGNAFFHGRSPCRRAPGGEAYTTPCRPMVLMKMEVRAPGGGEADF